MAYETMNPLNGEVLKRFDDFTDDQVELCLSRAVAAFNRWRKSRFSERQEKMMKVADLLEKRATDYGRTMAIEMGKPINEGEAEVKKCAWVCRFYAEKGEGFLKPVPHESDGSDAWVQFDPLGPVFAVMPWNFPFWQLFRHAAPGLMGGNVLLLKHASNVPQCAAAIEQVFLDAGCEPGMVQNLYATRSQTAKVIDDSRVVGVTLTGSTGAGKKIAEAAGRALKKSVLELGGSDPFIVMQDADIDEAAKVGVAARCINSGQSCIAAKRFLVHESVFDEYVGKFVDGMKARVMGDPLERETNIGPQARPDLRDELAEQVQSSVKKGAKILCGGEVPDSKGAFYPPTVLSNVPKESPAWCEEFFGPAASMIPFKNDEEMVEIANGTVFGLGASLWTKDMDRGRRLATEIESGAVFINGLVKSDPRLPFGGIKESGYGRELGREGIIEFVNAKTVWVK